MTDAPSVKIQHMSMQDFVERSSHERFEFIDGEVTTLTPTTALHAKIAKLFFLALLPYEQRGLGEVFQETTFVLAESSDWVTGSRIPDVMFVTRERMHRFRADVADSDNKPYILVPDIVIEIVSPTDKYTDINQKVRRYLDDGVRLVWVVDSQLRQVIVHSSDSNQQTTLSIDDALTAKSILPEFSLPLSEIFGQHA